MARDVLHMRKTWRVASPAKDVTAPVDLRPISNADEAGLGKLMWCAFHGSADDADYSGPEEAYSDARLALEGRWGPVIWEASLVAEVDDVLVSAVIVVRDNARGGMPLLAFAMTDPDFQRRGIGQLLIEESIRRLDAAEVKELHLAVVRTNPALVLYQRLGFVTVS